MALFQNATIVNVVNLINAAHRNNGLGEGNEQGDAAGYQLGDIIGMLADHYEDVEADMPWGSDEDIDMAMEIAYGELYVYNLGGSIHAR